MFDIINTGTLCLNVITCYRINQHRLKINLDLVLREPLTISYSKLLEIQRRPSN